MVTRLEALHGYGAQAKVGREFRVASTVVSLVWKNREKIKEDYINTSTSKEVSYGCVTCIYINY